MISCMHVKKRENKKTITIRKLHYIKEVIKSTLQMIIQLAYFQHLNTFNISPYHRSSSPIMIYESKDKDVKRKRKPNWSQDKLLLS